MSNSIRRNAIRRARRAAIKATWPTTATGKPINPRQLEVLAIVEHNGSAIVEDMMSGERRQVFGPIDLRRFRLV